MQFNIVIKEELKRIETVEASSVEEAKEKVKELYFNEDIVLDSDDFTGRFIKEDSEEEYEEF